LPSRELYFLPLFTEVGHALEVELGVLGPEHEQLGQLLVRGDAVEYDWTAQCLCHQGADTRPRASGISRASI
jgi:hypothetical protein